MPRVATRAAARRPGRRRYWWKDLPTPALLDLRLCDLGLTVERTWLARCVDRVLGEMKARGLRLEPKFWLSDEWFSPAGVPGVAIPFYLAHPRLIRLERAQMLHAEGATREECLRVLRHEVGHAVQHAYELHRRTRWQRMFGKSSAPYPEYYRPNPASKRFVQHLDYWYAQSHPDEDFAETFAVWLQPRSAWKRRYASWPALKKLEYVDDLMGQLAGQRPTVTRGASVDALPRLRKTLRQHYLDKRQRYAPGRRGGYDRDLQRVFSRNPRHRGRESAAAFVRRHRREIRQLVSRWTGEYEFTLDQVQREMMARCRELKLRAVGSERRLKLDFALLLTVTTMHYLYRGRYWRPL
jgi:hypothetical protein